MLFDLRAPGRKRLVQAIYLVLAVVLVGGIFVGVGTGLPSFLDSGTGTGGDTTLKDARERARTAEQRLTVRPRDPRLLLAAASARYDVGAAETGENATTPSRDTLAQWRTAGAHWRAYLATNPDPADTSVASRMVIAFQALRDNDDWADAQGIVTASQVAQAKRTGAPTPVGSYVALIQAETAAKRTRQARIHTADALAATPKDQRSELRQQIELLTDPKAAAAAQAAAAKGASGTTTQSGPITVPETTTSGK